jgi:hypothetical protein
VDDIPDEIKAMITANEEILYAIAPYEDRGLLHLRSLVLTNKRIIYFIMDAKINHLLCRYRFKGIRSMTEASWHDLKGVSITHDNSHLKRIGDVITLTMITGSNITIDHLKRDEAEKIYAISTRMKETSSSVLDTHSSPQTLTEIIKSLKEMLDEGLITQVEYDAKKADLLSRM